MSDQRDAQVAQAEAFDILERAVKGERSAAVNDATFFASLTAIVVALRERAEKAEAEASALRVLASPEQEEKKDDQSRSDQPQQSNSGPDQRGDDQASSILTEGLRATSRDYLHIQRVGLTVLQWAIERMENSDRIAKTKTGDDQRSWFEDRAYWRVIVDRLESVQSAAVSRSSSSPTPPEAQP